MLVVHSDIKAQAFAGAIDTAHANAFDCLRGGGWSLFFFDGIIPTTEQEVKARFNTQSLADMYNKSIGVAKSSYKQVFGRTLIEQYPMLEYQAKGATYCEHIGNGTLTLLTPDRIEENSETKKSISLIAAKSSVGVHKDYRGTQDFIVEFDSPVAVTHINLYGNANTMCDVVALVPSGETEIEQSLGVVSNVSGRLFAFGAPVEATRYKIKQSTSADSVQPFDLLSNLTDPQVDALVKPTWCALAHTNLLSHGDIHGSGEIMYIIDHVRNEGPYVTSTNLTADSVNYIYCPKIRLGNWSS